MNSIKRIVSLALVLGFVSTSLIGCNTVEGAGKDIEKAGEEISEEANDNR